MLTNPRNVMLDISFTTVMPANELPTLFLLHTIEQYSGAVLPYCTEGGKSICNSFEHCHC